MSAAVENVETIIIAVLAANTAFITAGLPAVPFERDVAAAGERVVVQAEVPPPDFTDPTGQTAIAQEYTLIIEIHAKTAAKCLAVLAAVEEAMDSETTPAVIALATSLFPLCFKVLAPTGLEREQGEMHITRRIYPIKTL